MNNQCCFTVKPGAPPCGELSLTKFCPEHTELMKQRALQKGTQAPAATPAGATERECVKCHKKAPTKFSGKDFTCPECFHKSKVAVVRAALPPAGVVVPEVPGRKRKCAHTEGRFGCEVDAVDGTDKCARHTPKDQPCKVVLKGMKCTGIADDKGKGRCKECLDFASEQRAKRMRTCPTPGCDGKFDPKPRKAKDGKPLPAHSVCTVCFKKTVAATLPQ
jgi:hypothetical protein